MLILGSSCCFHVLEPKRQSSSRRRLWLWPTAACSRRSTAELPATPRCRPRQGPWGRRGPACKALGELGDSGDSPGTSWGPELHNLQSTITSHTNMRIRPRRRKQTLQEIPVRALRSSTVTCKAKARGQAWRRHLRMHRPMRGKVLQYSQVTADSMTCKASASRT